MAERAAGAGTRWGIGGALLGASLLPLNSTMIAVALPDVAVEFARPPGSVTQTLVATYLIAAIVLQSPGGKLGDRLGHWRVIGLGQGVTAAGAVLGLLAPTLAALTVSRVLIAAGGAVLVPATAALLRSELPPQRRGRAFGTFGAVMSLAAGVGPVLGGELVTVLGWRSTFAVNLPVLAVSAVLVLAARRRATGPATSRPAGPGFDRVGSVLLAVTLSAFVLGLQVTGAAAALLIGACLVSLVPLIWWERRAPDPVLTFTLFRSVPYTAGTLLVAVQNLALYALLLELPQVLRVVLALDAAGTGRLLVFLMAATVVTSLGAGRLVDRFGPRPVATAGSLAGLGATGLLAVSGLTGVAELRWPLALLGVGIGLATPAAQSAALGAVGREQGGAAAGMSSTMRYLGGVVGVAVLGGLLDLDVGPAAILGEHRSVLAVFGGAFLVGLACALLLPGRRAQAPARSADPASPGGAGRSPG